MLKDLCATCSKHIQVQGSRGQPASKGGGAPNTPAQQQQQQHLAGGGNGGAGGGGGGGGAGAGGTSNPSGTAEEGQLSHSGSVDSLTGMQYAVDPTKPYEDPFPDSDEEEDPWKPKWMSHRVELTDTSEVFETINPSWLKWSDPQLMRKATKTHWKSWRPAQGMVGEVVYEWRPFHIDTLHRSHIDKTILLVKLELEGDMYVLVKEQGVQEVT